MHHAEDVIMGSILGVLCALITYRPDSPNKNPILHSANAPIVESEE